MLLRQLKEIFITELAAHYGENESSSIFHLCVEHFLKTPRFILAVQPNFTLNKKEVDLFFKTLNRLKNDEPIQYVLGETEFLGRVYKLNQSVLIPRPETEELVRWIMADMEGRDELKILDIGTGSGVIAISLALGIKGSRLSAVDFKGEILSVARKNAALHQADVDFSVVDILKDQELSGDFDIIVSNPPYVRESEKAEMAAHITKWEPGSALYVKDDDPLLYYKAIATFARKSLITMGRLYLEINQYLSEEVKLLLGEEKFSEIEIRKDSYGNDRMIKAVLLQPD